MEFIVSFQIRLFSVMCTLFAVSCQTSDFVNYFANCRKSDPRFDSCIKDALNSCRLYFKTGIPEYGIAPLDPFFAKEVAQKRGGPNLNYKLMLKNVYESGWTVSQVTQFKSNFDKNMVQYTQFFPDKQLTGDYEFSGNILGRKINNKGNWNLTLYDYVQTTTITRKPRRADNGTLMYDTPLRVKINIQTCKDLKLHISNLLRGRSVLENMLDQIINSAWQPGFIVLRPIINDLVSTAFTDIFTKSFQNFPFNEIIH